MAIRHKRSKHLHPRQAKPNDLAKRLRRYARFTTLFLFLTLVIWSIMQLHRPSTLPIYHIHVRGDYQYMDKQAIKQILQPVLNQGFFYTDIDQLQQQLQALPWLASADIRKIWPDSLVITLTERIAFARWGNDSIMSRKGKIFTPKHLDSIPNNLPQFNAPLEHADDVFSAYKRMNQQLQPLGLSVVDIDLSSRLAWCIVLSDGIIITIGREHLFDRLQRLIDVYPKVVGDKADKVEGIDLRYSNGLAVKWAK